MPALNIVEFTALGAVNPCNVSSHAIASMSEYKIPFSFFGFKRTFSAFETVLRDSVAEVLFTTFNPGINPGLIFLFLLLLLLLHNANAPLWAFAIQLFPDPLKTHLSGFVICYRIGASITPYAVGLIPYHFITSSLMSVRHED